jgi:hypothetical protein
MSIWQVLAEPDQPASWDDHESMKCKIEREWRQYQERQYQEQCGYQKVKPQDNVGSPRGSLVLSTISQC